MIAVNVIADLLFSSEKKVSARRIGFTHVQRNTKKVYLYNFKFIFPLVVKICDEKQENKKKTKFGYEINRKIVKTNKVGPVKNK